MVYTKDEILCSQKKTNLFLWKSDGTRGYNAERNHLKRKGETGMISLNCGYRENIVDYIK